MEDALLESLHDAEKEIAHAIIQAIKGKDFGFIKIEIEVLPSPYKCIKERESRFTIVGDPNEVVVQEFSINYNNPFRH